MTGEEAINLIADMDGDKYTAKEAVALAMAIKALEQTSKTGRWIEHDFEQLRKMGYYRCSECNIGYQRYERGERKSELPNINGQKYELHRIDNYCPNCGCKMEVEENE